VRKAAAGRVATRKDVAKKLLRASLLQEEE